MLETDLTERRQSERRKRVARCGHRIARRDIHEKCSAPARWRCTGCGRFGCPRHRIRLDNPELCNICTGKIVHFVERAASRRQD